MNNMTRTIYEALDHCVNHTCRGCPCDQGLFNCSLRPDIIKCMKLNMGTNSFTRLIQQAELQDRNSRYVLRYRYVKDDFDEFYANTIEEVKEAISNLDDHIYEVYDRVDGTKIMEGRPHWLDEDYGGEYS